MSHYQLCPVCSGRGIVAKGFYESLKVLEKDEVENCRSCSGAGTLFVMDGFTINTPPARPEPVVQPWWDQWPPNTWISTSPNLGDTNKIDFGAGVFDEPISE